MLYLTLCFVLSASFIAYKVYELFKVPEDLKHVPQISFFKFILSFIKGEPFDVRHKKLIEPTIGEKEYGIIWQQGAWEIIVSDVTSIKYIFNHTDVFLKKKDKDFTENQLRRKFFGISNVVSNDKQEWKRHRRIINPAFKKTWPVELFGECANDLIDVIQKNGTKPIVLNDLFSRLTLDALGKGLFSFHFEAVNNSSKSEMINAYNEVTKEIFNPIYFTFPVLESIVPSRQYYHHKNEEFRSFLAEIITLRKKEIENGNSKDDLISLLLKNMKESTKESLSNNEVINNLATFFLAGHDTTANTLTSTVYYLAKYPEMQQKVRKEIVCVLGNSGNAIPSHEQQKKFTYLNCFIKETMRIITTVGILRRYCDRDEILPNTLLVKEGTYLNCYLWGTHHNSKYFPNPDKFDPDRFLDPYGEQSNSWMPFGGGSRLCVGINFSLIEQRIVLSMLLQRYELKLGPKSKEWKTPLLTTAGFVYPKDLDIQFIKIAEDI
ncbi:cytochrome P450 [Neoconidiobolus thromboides FSU 785]|nr:cytochrome P450 [Neoconidiobolus thromboides FSU 785]